MAKDKKVEQTNKKGKRGKSKVQLKLDKLKEVLKKGTKEHLDAIDKVIQQYDDYTKLSALEIELETLRERIEVAKTTKANQVERDRMKAEAEKKKAEESKQKPKKKKVEKSK